MEHYPEGVLVFDTNNLTPAKKQVENVIEYDLVANFRFEQIMFLFEQLCANIAGWAGFCVQHVWWQPPGAFLSTLETVPNLQLTHKGLTDSCSSSP